MRDKRISLSSNIISEKAQKLAETMGYLNFRASNRYIEGLKKRENIRFITTHGESESVSPEVVDNWEKQLKNEIKGFQPKDVYNFDETALFYRLLPNKTYAFGDESRHGYKQFKERVTIVLISNADGQEGNYDRKKS
jgi:hypothetical protein